MNLSSPIRKILSVTDHTMLRTDAGWPEIAKTVEEGIAFGTASVCIPPAFVEQAARHAGGRVKICTVIGFPNGYSTSAIKQAEAAEAVRLGAEELDMVINVAWLKSGEDARLRAEIQGVKEACAGRTLKVIVEACLLDQAEKLRICRILEDAGADFLKTSTGFAKGGATLEDVRFFRANLKPELRIKAAGGIRSLEDAAAFLAAGADRIGASALVAAAQMIC